LFYGTVPTFVLSADQRFLDWNPGFQLIFGSLEGIRRGLQEYNQDVAFFELELPVEGVTDYMKILLAKAPYLKGRSVSAAGYSGDRKEFQFMGGLQNGCNVHSTQGNMLFTDCDVAPGASGGPLVVYSQSGEPRLVGVLSTALGSDSGDEHFSRYDHIVANIFTTVRGQRFEQRVTDLLKAEVDRTNYDFKTMDGYNFF